MRKRLSTGARRTQLTELLDMVRDFDHSGKLIYHTSTKRPLPCFQFSPFDPSSPFFFIPHHSLETSIQPPYFSATAERVHHGRRHLALFFHESRYPSSEDSLPSPFVANRTTNEATAMVGVTIVQMGESLSRLLLDFSFGNVRPRLDRIGDHGITS